MKTIGIRQLRQNASEYIRLVQAGETVEVTDRGRPVALLTPIRTESVLERLIREGRATPPTSPLREFHPIQLAPGEKTITEMLLEERESYEF
ncbi:MAG: type II toxin-antitoxin system Phd/YefM family antitoxin [Tepidiformaceae bacterium]